MYVQQLYIATSYHIPYYNHCRRTKVAGKCHYRLVPWIFQLRRNRDFIIEISSRVDVSSDFWYSCSSVVPKKWGYLLFDVMWALKVSSMPLERDKLSVARLRVHQECSQPLHNTPFSTCMYVWIHISVFSILT